MGRQNQKRICKDVPLRMEAQVRYWVETAERVVVDLLLEEMVTAATVALSAQ